MTWTETLRTGWSAVRVARDALDPDRARHPHRHRRGDPHRRPRPRHAEGRQRADQLAGQQPAHRHARAAAPTPTGVRGGLRLARDADHGRRRGARLVGQRARHRQASPPRRRRSLSLEANDTNWTTTRRRHHARTGSTSAAARSRPGRSSRPTTRPSRARGRRARARDRRASCSARTRVVGQTVTIGDTDLRVVGVLDGRGRVRRRATSTTSRSSRCRRRRTRWSAAPTATPSRRSTCRPRRPTSCSAAYQEARDPAAQPARRSPTPTAPTSRSTARTPWSRTATAVYRTLTVLLTGIAGAVAAGRRHRRHEHHARLGHRADPRDRSAQGARRPAVGDPPAVPGRGHGARPGRRACSARSSGSSPRRSCPALLDTSIVVSGAAVAGSVVVADGHRPGVRRLPRHPRRAAGPHRRAARGMSPPSKESPHAHP